MTLQRSQAARSFMRRRPPGKKSPKTQNFGSMAGQGAVTGAFWGMLFGLIFFVPVFGLAVGSAMGALSSKFTDYGINDAFTKEVREQVTKGTSALFLMTSGAAQDRVSAAFKGDGMELIRSKRSLDRMQQRRTKSQRSCSMRRDFGVGGLSSVCSRFQ
jgi:uncharacterized membrane protein